MDEYSDGRTDRYLHAYHAKAGATTIFGSSEGTTLPEMKPPIDCVNSQKYLEVFPKGKSTRNEARHRLCIHLQQHLEVLSKGEQYHK